MVIPIIIEWQLLKYSYLVNLKLNGILFSHTNY